MNDNFYFKDIFDKLIWEVKNVDINNLKILGWVIVLCIDLGEDNKVFVG